MSPSPRRSGLRTAIYRLCLRAYPRWFRAAHAADMIATFEDVFRARGGSVPQLVGEYGSLLSRGIRERFHATPAAPARSGPRISSPQRLKTTLREARNMYVLSNLKHALRGLVRTPGYTLAFVLTLGLGIGANTAIFSVINGVLLRPLPYPEADRIMYMQQVAANGGTNNTALSFVEAADYREQASTIDELVEYGDWTFNVLDRGEPHLTTAGLVTANFFTVLGLQPHIGRTLIPTDDERTSDPVVVLTHEYWTRVFGADSNVLGQTLNLTVKNATIVGVLEPGSHYTSMRGNRQDFYANYPANDHYMSAAMQDERAHRMTDVFLRLKPGVAVDEARVEVAAIARRLYEAYPAAYPERRGYEMVVTPWREEITRNARPMLLILFGTAVFVLIIACANVANLTLTRLIRREREMAIRAALGAGRARLRGQLLAENLVLSLTGGSLGLVLAVTGLDLLVAYASRFTNRTGEIGIDLPVLAFTLFIAVGAAILFAWAPSLPVSKDIGTSLTAAGGGRATGGLTRRRAQRALVVSQLAISFMLLVGAGLLVRSLVQLSRVDPGFDVEHVLTMGVPSFSNATQAQQREFERTITDRVEGHSHVRNAAMASGAPLGRNTPVRTQFVVEGLEKPEQPVMPPTMLMTVGPEYFTTIGTPLLRGRAFNSGDHTDAPLVTIISKSMADFYFPDQDPIGRRITREFSNGQLDRWYTVVGIVADSKAAGLDQDPVHTFYNASSQWFVPSTLLVRTEGDPAPVAGQVIEEIRALDPSRPVVNVQTLQDLREENMAPQRLNATLFAIFAGLALVIATVGIAGVLAFSVNERRHEFGIRMTLGADQARVLRMVLREGVLLATVALTIGGVGALGLSQFLSGFLFEVQPTDPLTFVAVATLLAVVAIAASLAPARSATSVDPLEALRTD